MTEVLLGFWVISAIFIFFAKKINRVIIHFGVFSLLSSVGYLFLGAPDVAMAEAAISVFVTVFFIICIEKYYGRLKIVRSEEASAKRLLKSFTKMLPALLFTIGLLGLFIYFIPDNPVSTYLKDRYLTMFMTDIGGQNAVTAIYLGYRVYDTLFEALILVISVVAVTHMSWSTATEVSDGPHSEIEKSGMAIFTVRIVCPIILIFAVYLIANGHISAGGGFQGGVAVATFFICRYLIHNIYDIHVHSVQKLEEIVFILIIVIPILVIFMGALFFTQGVVSISPELYLIAMNILIGLKVACGFFILFYRYIAIERR